MILFSVEYNGSIKEVESERQTDKSVFINGARSAWKSYWSVYFKTRQEAKDYAIKAISDEIAILESKLKYNNEKLDKAKSI